MTQDHERMKAAEAKLAQAIEWLKTIANLPTPVAADSHHEFIVARAYAKEALKGLRGD